MVVNPYRKPIPLTESFLLSRILRDRLTRQVLEDLKTKTVLAMLELMLSWPTVVLIS